MKVKPMIFNTEMVKAILAGKKTVTRRPINVQPSGDDHKALFIVDSTDKKEVGKIKWFDGDSTYGNPIKKTCEIGDLIYVRETFAALGHNDYQQVSPRNITEIHEYRYKASERESIANCKDHEVRGYKWVPSIHMPRYASRLTLKVTDVRIERAQDISEEQAEREGVISTEDYGELAGEENLFDCPECQGFQVHGYIGYNGGVGETDCFTCDTAVKRFGILWDSIYQNWDKNPYVWVIEFEVIHQNVDKCLELL